MDRLPPSPGPERHRRTAAGIPVGWTRTEARQHPVERRTAALRVDCLVSGLHVSADHRFAGRRHADAIFAISLASGERTPLTHPLFPVIADIGPSVSPDGRWLVFSRNITPLNGVLHRVALGPGLMPTGEPSPLSLGLVERQGRAWMPDSERIVFSAMRRSVDHHRARQKHAVARAVRRRGRHDARSVGRYERAIASDWSTCGATRTRTSGCVDTSEPGAPATSALYVAIASTKADLTPQFSPDGKRVAFTSARSGTLEIGRPIPMEPMRCSCRPSVRLPASLAGRRTAMRWCSMPIERGTERRFLFPPRVGRLGHSRWVRAPRSQTCRPTDNGSTSAREALGAVLSSGECPSQAASGPGHNTSGDSGPALARRTQSLLQRDLRQAERLVAPFAVDRCRDQTPGRRRSQQLCGDRPRHLLHRSTCAAVWAQSERAVRGRGTASGHLRLLHE